MLQLFPLDSANAAPFTALLAPEVRWLLGALPPAGAPKNRVTAVGATLLDRPVGIVVAETAPGGERALLHELHVSQPYRKQGIGRRLLAAVEDELRARGCTYLRTVYEVDDATPVFEKLLARAGWNVPVVSRFVFWSSIMRLNEVPWFQRFSPPAGCSIFPWVQLTEQDRDAVSAVFRSGALDPALNPLQFTPDEIDPTLSLGMRCGERLVGWVIVCPMGGPNDVSYEILWINPEIRGARGGIFLLNESFHRGRETGRTITACWGVRPNNEPMLRFVRRHLAPCLDAVGEERASLKNLKDIRHVSLSPSLSIENFSACSGDSGTDLTAQPAASAEQ